MNSQVNAAVREIADRYRCDSSDPIFGILEKVCEFQQGIQHLEKSLGAKEREALDLLNQSLKFELGQIQATLSHFKDVRSLFERDAKVIAECTSSLEKYWRQIHWYHALTGMVVTLLLCSLGFGAYYYKSADRILSKAGLQFTSESLSDRIRLSLSGKDIMDSGRTSDKVVIDFRP